MRLYFVLFGCWLSQISVGFSQDSEKKEAQTPASDMKAAVKPESVAPATKTEEVIPPLVSIEQTPVLSSNRSLRSPFWTDLQTIRWYGNRGSLASGRADIPGIDDPSQGWLWPKDLFVSDLTKDARFQLDGVIRGFYRNDQRIEWSGVEATMGTEAVLRPIFNSEQGKWLFTAEGEFFLNQPYGSTVLSDPTRDPFRANFEQVENFEIFQLYVDARYEDFVLRVGKSRTPFGRYQSPMFSNLMMDAPFLRTEVISFTETGLFFRYDPGPIVADIAVVNGEPNLDTNSSKAFIGRVGIEQDFFTIGASMKYHDGTGSEFQKRYNNHFGIDFNLRYNRFMLYGEAVYDQHGFHEDFFSNFQNRSTLGVRSLYGRDVFIGKDQAVSGQGAYIGIAYRGDITVVDLSIGVYEPEQIGIPSHDDSIQRAILKVSHNLTANVQLFAVGLVENKRAQAAAVLESNNPYAFLFGMQCGF